VSVKYLIVRDLHDPAERDFVVSLLSLQDLQDLSLPPVPRAFAASRMPLAASRSSALCPVPDLVPFFSKKTIRPEKIK